MIYMVIFAYNFLRNFFNSHLFRLNSHPFFHPKHGRTQVWGLWSIRAQLKGCEFNQKGVNLKFSFFNYKIFLFNISKMN
jgi:hypothetical protein